MTREEKLRSFVPRRTQVAPPAHDDTQDTRISVFSWLADVGHAVIRKLKPVPSSPLARIHD